MGEESDFYQVHATYMITKAQIFWEYSGAKVMPFFYKNSVNVNTIPKCMLESPLFLFGGE